MNATNTNAQSGEKSSTIDLQVPIGTVLPFAGKLDVKGLYEQGWLYCDGSEYSMEDTAYASLYQIIGNSFGANGIYFRVPDCRGLFLRGVDESTGRDPDAGRRTVLYPGGHSGDAVGSYEADGLGSHNHGYSHGFREDSNTWKGGGQPDGGYVGYRDPNVATGSTGGSETRPKNLYMYYIIKFK